MYKNKSVLALIPARGGSKGVSRKNVRHVAGKPLIAWTIGEAKKSLFLDSIIVSTDDGQIASVARRSGARVPFMRPKKLATDKADMMSVVMHALDWTERHGERYDYLLLLQPSSPLRTADDIDGAIRELIQKRRMSIVSVCEVDHPPHWSNVLPRSGSMRDFINTRIIGKNRQDIRTFYRINGAIYIASTKYLKKRPEFVGADTYAFIMPKERSVDIDTEFDLKVADLLLRGDIEGCIR